MCEKITFNLLKSLDRYIQTKIQHLQHIEFKICEFLWGQTTNFRIVGNIIADVIEIFAGKNNCCDKKSVNCETSKNEIMMSSDDLRNIVIGCDETSFRTKDVF